MVDIPLMGHDAITEDDNCHGQLLFLAIIFTPLIFVRLLF